MDSNIYGVMAKVAKVTLIHWLKYSETCIVWHECNKSLSDKLEQLQHQAMRVILSANRTTCTLDKQSRATDNQENILLV